MYLDCTIKIPEVDGKITKKKIKQTIYIYYEYARIYDRDKKYNSFMKVSDFEQKKSSPMLI
jgi:hypothetical protein